MDIHRPKAAHSGREFLIEIGTIICGILIALGLEQAVDAAHVRHEVSEARVALHHEIENDLGIAALWQQEHACWIGAADATVGWAGGKRDRPSIPPGIMTNYHSTVWDMTKAGPVTHMPLEEQLALAEFYDSIATDTAVIETHRSMATEIGGYLELERLSAAEADGLIKLVGQLRWMSNVEFGNGQRILQGGAALKLTGATVNPDIEKKVAAFCEAFGPLP